MIEKKIIESILKKGRELKKAGEAFSSAALIKMLRKALGLTQEQLAKRSKMPRSTISRIENETIHANESTLRTIFAAMECDLAFLPIPRFSSIEDLHEKRARKIAKKRGDYLAGTMALEKQLPTDEWQKELEEHELKRLLKKPAELWETDDAS